MKYMGSKARIAKEILSIVLRGRTQGQYYVEPFLGGANSMQYVQGKRIGGEVNPYIADMWLALLAGWKPNFISRETYNDIKCNKNSHNSYLVGWCGIACSYSGKWFGGYAGRTTTKQGIRDYQQEAINNVNKQLPILAGLRVFNSSYDELRIPKNSKIYCDPPYQGTTKYSEEFDHDAFFDWCRAMKSKGHEVYVSEYYAPKDFKLLWTKQLSSSLSANGKIGGNKISTEKLFTL